MPVASAICLKPGQCPYLGVFHHPPNAPVKNIQKWFERRPQLTRVSNCYSNDSGASAK